MKKKILTPILLLFLFCNNYALLGQNDLKKIFQTEDNFYQITEKVDAYYKIKHPGKSAKDLTTGVHRDGNFVKYMRWRSFWQHHLNEDGTLGDLSTPRKSLSAQEKNANNNFYNDINWSNISYNNYITGQISMGRTTSLGFHPTDPNTFYVGAPIGGIWKTTDGGQNYIPLGDELPYLAVSSIVVDQVNPENIYIAISDHVWYGPPSIGVYKSTDEGLTWNPTALSFQFSQNIRIYWMEADPNDPMTIYVGTANGLYRTTDGFQTVNMLNNHNVYDIRFKPNDSNTIYYGTNDGKFFKSTNAGALFTEIIDFGNSSVKLAVNSFNPQVVAARHNSDLHQSFDSGASFAQSNALPEGNTMPCYAPNNTNTLLVGNFEIFRSDDGGNNYNQITQWLGNGGLPLIHVDQRNVFVNPLENNYIYFCNDGGVYRYDLAQAQFEDLSDGLKITQYYDIAVSQTNINVLCGGAQDNGSMFRDASGVWEEFAATGDGMNTEIDPTDENILYWEYQNGAMRRYQNGANTNISPAGQDGNGAWETPYRLDPTNPDRIIAGYDQVYESLDKGDSWNSLSGSLAGGTNLNHIAISKSNPNRVYAVQGTTLYVKDVASNTWTTKATPASINISDIEVDPLDMDIIYIANSGYANAQKVFKSTDAGDNWTNISGTLPNVTVSAIELYEDVANGIFIGTDNGVFYQDYQLTDWELYGVMPNTRVTDIEIQYAQQMIRVGTHGRGVLEAPIDVVLCLPSAPDYDNDGICNLIDACPYLHDNMIGTACDDGDPLSSGETFSTNCICEGGISNIAYCSANGSDGTGSDWIKRVALNTIDNVSAQTNYSDFRDIQTDLVEEANYTLTMELNHAFALDEAYAWIDFNRDGTFAASEAIPMSSFNSNNVSTGTFVVPEVSTYGVTTMRVRNIYSSSNSPDPCNNYFGEVEDYTIRLIDDCPDNIIYSGQNYFTSDNVLELAENQITVDNILIQSGANVTYDAGFCIDLLPEFEVEQGSTFEAIIGGCVD